MSGFKGRWCVVWGVWLAVSTVWGQEQEQGQASPIQARPQRTELSGAVASIPLDTKLGQPVVQVLVNGKGPYRMVLDTGARFTKIDDDLLPALNLKPEQRMLAVHGPGEASEPVQVVRLESMSAGGARFLGFEAMVLDYDQVFEQGREYDGVIGYPVFADVLLTLEYSQQVAVLKQGELPPADKEEVLDYVAADGLARIPLATPGTPVEVVIDSGRAGAITLAESLRGRVRVTTKPVHLGPVAADLGVPAAPLRGTLRLGRHQLVEPPVFFVGGDSAIGHRILEHFIVTLDQKNARVRFDRAGSEPIRFAPDAGFGIVVGRKRGRLVIKHVVPGSPADRVALRAGDAIREVNARSAYEYDEGSLTRILEASQSVTLQLERNGYPLLVRLEKDVEDSSKP
jgi:hypothetical protein